MNSAKPSHPPTPSSSANNSSPTWRWHHDHRHHPRVRDDPRQHPHPHARPRRLSAHHQLPQGAAMTEPTYRPLDHWVRRGYLKPEHAGGSGHPRSWPPEEVRVAYLMTRLVTAGLTHGTAHTIARKGFGSHRLAPGITIKVGAA